MDDYENLLEKAMQSVPQKAEGRKRFVMPQVVAESQGPKTAIRNFGEIASALRREPAHVAKFFTKELAAPGNIQNGMLILQAKVSRENLQKKLEAYVKDFVYCKVCGQPDTRLEKDNRISSLRCDACGARSAVKHI
jgi:translation initiation factor 2 subunit 2